jgi:hypothetical protein
MLTDFVAVILRGDKVPQTGGNDYIYGLHRQNGQLDIDNPTTIPIPGSYPFDLQEVSIPTHYVNQYSPQNHCGAALIDELNRIQMGDGAHTVWGRKHSYPLGWTIMASPRLKIFEPIARPPDSADYIALIVQRADGGDKDYLWDLRPDNPNGYGAYNLDHPENVESPGRRHGRRFLQVFSMRPETAYQVSNMGGFDAPDFLMSSPHIWQGRSVWVDEAQQ